MPISERDIFASLMTDPNHAYNPIEKVWAEAQQRARQFRNNEKALALGFDETPALEKLFDFIQKADASEFNIDKFKESLEGKGTSTGLFGYDDESSSNVKDKVASFVKKWEAHSDLIEQAFGIQISELQEFLSEYANGNNSDKREAANSMVNQIENLSSDMERIDEQYQAHMNPSGVDDSDESSSGTEEEEEASHAPYEQSLIDNIDNYKAFIANVKSLNEQKRFWDFPENQNPLADPGLIVNHSFGKDKTMPLGGLYNALNVASGKFSDLIPFLEELKDSPGRKLEDVIGKTNPVLLDFMTDYTNPRTGVISPLIIQGLSKYANHPFVQEQNQIVDNAAPEGTRDEDAYAPPVLDGLIDDDSEPDAAPSTDTPPKGLVEDDTPAGGTPVVETPPVGTQETATPTEGVPAFDLTALNGLIRANAGNYNKNFPKDEKGWGDNPQLKAGQFNALRKLGLVNKENTDGSMGDRRNYEWAEAGKPWEALLTHAIRTQAQSAKGNKAQPLNDTVFSAMMEAYMGGSLTGHVPTTAINTERNENEDPNSTVEESDEGPVITAAPEPTTPTAAQIPAMTSEGWEAYMNEYPHKEVDTYAEGEGISGPRLDQADRKKTRLLPREMPSWENGEFVEGADIDPLRNEAGTLLNDMKDAEGNLTPEGEAHVQNMFRKLLDIFKASSNRNHPDSLSRRFGTYNREDDPYYYDINVEDDGFNNDAYNSYMENNGVLEQYLKKFGGLLRLTTDRIERYRLPDPDKTMPIIMGEASDLINPATNEPYTEADLEAFTNASAEGDANAWPENLLGPNTQERLTYNTTLPEDHPAYRGGIYDQSKSQLGDDIYIHPNAWEWADALYSQGLVDPATGYPGFHMLSRKDYDREGGHGLKYGDIWKGVNTIQALLNLKGLEGIDPETGDAYSDLAQDYNRSSLWKTTHEEDKAKFKLEHEGSMDGAYGNAWNDYQTYLGNPTAEHDPARVIPEAGQTPEEQEIATRRESKPDFWAWTQNFLNGDYADVMGDVWPTDQLNAEGLGPNGSPRMHLYKEDAASSDNHRQPLLKRSDRMERWGFAPEIIGAAVQEEAVAPSPDAVTTTTPVTAPEGTADENAVAADATGGNAADSAAPLNYDMVDNRKWVWVTDEDNPLEGGWEWKIPSDAENLKLGGTPLLQDSNAKSGDYQLYDGTYMPFGEEKENIEPEIPETITTRNKQIRQILEQQFGKDYEEQAQNDSDLQDEIDGEIGSMINHHENNRLESEHDKRVIQVRRKAREKARAEEEKPTKTLTDADKPIEADELERMLAAYKSAVENTGIPVDENMENYMRMNAASTPKQFRSDYGAALKLNAKHIADSNKRQLQVDANDIEGYRGILPLQQMPTQDDVTTQIRRLEYWKNKHGEHMTDATRKIWNQRWQEISQAAANIPDFDMDEFIVADKAQAEQDNVEYGGEDHLKAAGKAHVKEMYGEAAYMKAVGEGGALRSNRNHKPWLVIKYDSNGAGTVHDLRQRDERTGEWGKEIDPNSLEFDEDTHYFDYNETPGNQPQPSAAEKFWSKVDRYANFRPLDHRGALERFDNDDTKFAKTKNLLGEQGVQHGWFHPESGAWINPHRYNDVRDELAAAGAGSGMMIPAGEHYHGSHRANGQGEPNPRYAFARRGKAKTAQMNNNNDLSYYVDSQGNINHADAEWSAVQQKDKTQPQTVNDVIHDYHSQQFYNYFTQTADSFKDSQGNFLTGKVLRPQNPPQTPPQAPLQMQLLKDVLEGDALERRRKQSQHRRKAQPGSKDLQTDELGHSGEFWGRNQEYQQRYQDVLNYPGSGIVGWLGGIINPFAVVSDVSTGGIGRGVKGVVSRALGNKDPAFEAIRRIRRQYRVDAEAEQRTKDVMDKLEMHGKPMRYLSPGEAQARSEDIKDLRNHVSKRVKWHQQEAKKLGAAQRPNTPRSQEHQDHIDRDLEYQNVNNQLNGLNSELDSDWGHINRLYDRYMGNQQVQDKFAPHPSEGDGSWASRFENPPQAYQPSQTGQPPSGGLSGLIGDDSPQSNQLQGLVGDDSGNRQQNTLQGLIA
mgnify:CR=1 FL=1